MMYLHSVSVLTSPLCCFSPLRHLSTFFLFFLWVFWPVRRHRHVGLHARWSSAPAVHQKRKKNTADFAFYSIQFFNCLYLVQYRNDCEFPAICNHL